MSLIKLQRLKSKTKLLLLFVLLVLVYMIINYEPEKLNDWEINWKDEHIIELKDILSYKFEHESNKNMFFLDTTVLVKKDPEKPAYFTNRQACSIESAALMNPDYKVFVIFLEKFNIGDSPPIRTLQKLENVIFLRMDFEKFVENTPVEEWVRSGEIYKTKFLVFNVSDLLKAMLQWR